MYDKYGEKGSVAREIKWWKEKAGRKKRVVK